MQKDILVITGSPRKNGNSDLMADAFIKGAHLKGHRVTKFKAAEKKSAAVGLAIPAGAKAMPAHFTMASLN